MITEKENEPTFVQNGAKQWLCVDTFAKPLLFEIDSNG